MNYNNRYMKLRKHFDSKNYNSPSKIGHIMDIMKVLRPISAEDWKIKYFDYCQKTGLINSINEIQDYLMRFEDADYVKEFLNDRLIARPFNGYKAELFVMKEYFIQHQELLFQTDKNLDEQYGVDLIKRDSEDNIVLAIQVKNGSTKLKADQQEKKELFEEKYGVPVTIVQVALSGNGDWYISKGYEELNLPYKKPNIDYKFNF